MLAVLNDLHGGYMRRTSSCTAALLLMPSSGAFAQDYAITPFFGWRTSSSLEQVSTGASIDLRETRSYGVLLSMRQKSDSYYDFLFSRQNTELESSTLPSDATSLRFDYFHFGGTVFYGQDRLKPFVTGGLGATHISPANDLFSSETGFSLSIGGGLKFALAPQLAVRLEIRGYGTVTDGVGSILCADGRCIAKFSGSLFMQYEANAGLSFAF